MYVVEEKYIEISSPKSKKVLKIYPNAIIDCCIVSGEYGYKPYKFKARVLSIEPNIDDESDLLSTYVHLDFSEANESKLKRYMISEILDADLSIKTVAKVKTQYGLAAGFTMQLVHDNESFLDTTLDKKYKVYIHETDFGTYVLTVDGSERFKSNKQDFSFEEAYFTQRSIMGVNVKAAFLGSEFPPESIEKIIGE